MGIVMAHAVAPEEGLADGAQMVSLGGAEKCHALIGKVQYHGGVMEGAAHVVGDHQDGNTLLPVQCLDDGVQFGGGQGVQARYRLIQQQ